MIRRIMTWRERRRKGRWEVRVETRLEHVPTPSRRVLVIGRWRNAEHKSDVKKKRGGADCVYRLIMRPVVFLLGHVRMSEASRLVALGKLWLPQPSMFRVRVTSEYVSLAEVR